MTVITTRAARPQTIAITGATGFVGTMLVRYHRERGDSVRILSRHPALASPDLHGSIPFQGDLSGDVLPYFLEGADAVYHLAAELGDESRMHTVNVAGTSNLLRAAVSAGVRRWVQLSSVGVYGPPTSPVVTEATVPMPLNEYERTKLAADRLVEETGNRTTLEYAILRPSNVIGAKMKNGSFAALVNAVRRGRFCYFGPSGSIATYVHVDDVARALIACRDAPSGGTFNLSSDCMWEELIDQISLLIGVPPPRLRIPAMPVKMALCALGGRMPLPLTRTRLASLTNRCRYSSERIVRELGFTYSRPMPTGIENVVAVMR
jgi:nucleoside-diphosphate-sugar epimerase